MSACPTEADRDAGHPDAMRFLPGVASEVHRARHAATCGGIEPRPLSAPGCPNLFAPARPGRADPYEADDVTMRDPTRRVYVRIAALEAPIAAGSSEAI